MTRETHAYCPTCREVSAIDIEGRCLWCQGETRKSQRGKPKGKYGFISPKAVTA